MNLLVCATKATLQLVKMHTNSVPPTDKYAKHTFQAPRSCFESGLTKDLLLVETMNVSIDCVVIKYLISMKRKMYGIERQHKVLFGLFSFDHCEQRK